MDELIWDMCLGLVIGIAIVAVFLAVRDVVVDRPATDDSPKARSLFLDEWTDAVLTSNRVAIKSELLFGDVQNHGSLTFMNIKSD